MQQSKRIMSGVLCLAVAGALLGTSACVTRDRVHAEFGWERRSAEAALETPLGGQALIHRKQELERAKRDVEHFYETLVTLRERRDRSGYLMLASFMDAYFGLHLEPLLVPRWQSSHPEVMALDVSLRMSEAELYIQIHDPKRAQDVIDEVWRRYEGREGMLVELPTGGEGTLGEAIDSICDRKWWKG